MRGERERAQEREVSILVAGWKKPQTGSADASWEFNDGAQLCFFPSSKGRDQFSLDCLVIFLTQYFRPISGF